MSWAGCQNNLIDVNFHLQISLEIVEKKSADKIWSNEDKGIKMPPPPWQIGLMLNINKIAKSMTVASKKIDSTDKFLVIHPRILKNNIFHIPWTAWSSQSKSKIAYMI